MKDFIFKNKFILILFFIVCILETLIFSTCFGMNEGENINLDLGIVNTDYLNLRTGPGIDYTSIDLLTKNQYLRIYGKIGDWYIVQNDNNNIGTVHSKYITLTENPKASVSNMETIETVATPVITTDEELVLELINTEREKNNLSKFKIDNELQNIARLKAEDIVKYNYFSHISPTYGTPFEMLKSYNIQYKIASENIAGNASLEKAVSSWMNSESHKENILSNLYNYTGIAVVDSIAYGKIIVELFIGK